eukprot:TRINITY_DN78663_c0_g1_i1.p1 TRINITY_DN78663_c0_g1~~TRINITY_DN78663_c0_g1_i1.p1  ORF type:complete len:453 (+),score=53.20 TRINITY_DN78663_c0_g1_i1:60-1418(+)
MEIPLSSGIVTSLYFVFLELGIERLVFELTARVQAHELLRSVSNGQTISARPSVIPVLGDSLRHRSSRATFLALLLRIVLIAAIFLVNFGTEGASRAVVRPISRAYVAYQNAEDAEWFKNGSYTFNRDFNALSGCARETENGLDYFDLALDLMSGERNLSDLDESWTVESASRKVDFAHSVCLDGFNFLPRKLAMRVEGCGPRAAKCKASPTNATWKTSTWQVNDLSSAFVQSRLIAEAQVIGLQSGNQMAECVYAIQYANCAVWNASVDSKMLKITIINLMDVGELRQARNGSVVSLRMGDTSGTAVISGGSFGRISVAHAIADSTSRHPDDILEVINRIFSRSVEYRPNEDELFVLSGSQSVTQIDDLALSAAVVLMVATITACMWVFAEKWRSKSSKLCWWKFTSSGLLTVWNDDVTGAQEGRDQFPIVQQMFSAHGIVRVGAQRENGA